MTVKLPGHERCDVVDIEAFTAPSCYDIHNPKWYNINPSSCSEPPFRCLYGEIRQMEPILVDQLPDAQSLFGVKRYAQSTFSMPWHLHNFFELTLIVEGHGTRIVGDSIDSFAAGDLLLIGPQLPHVWKNEESNSTNLAKAITVQFADGFPAPDFLGLAQMNPVVKMYQMANRGIQLRGELKSRTTARMEALPDQRGARQLLTLLEILVDVALSPEKHPMASERYSPPASVDMVRWSEINRYILDRFREPITAAELANIAQMHPSSLGRYIKRMSGLTLTQYVNQFRVGHACGLLANEQKPIVDICFDSGFQNLSHFNRYFRRSKGCSPSEYRRTLNEVMD
ncbi:HTH-type transcriptional activator RhaR [Planctomycetes bacterium CA13]|uniref:HTH-type transcriptional activator RhaR n=1 Tax=Novipirellula herctigrandis TaxID=2527986 RepID=A0A5C5Z4W0_9BACT|nr:HTH-type transcriptional activator RhaR [Planctomycetes bacterium CA13]